MKLFIGILFAVVADSAFEPRPAGGLACGAFRSRSARRRYPQTPVLVSFAPGVADALCNFPRCARFVYVLLFEHLLELRIDEAPHRVAVLENPPACDVESI